MTKIVLDTTAQWKRWSNENARVPYGPQLFVSWKNVDPGEVIWARDGKQIKGSLIAAPPAETAGAAFGSFGVRLEAQKGTIEGPLSPMDLPWETHYNMYFSTVVYEDGWYKAWYSCVPSDTSDPATGLKRRGYGHVLCFARSRDGFEWEKPELGLTQYNGQETNIVFGRDLSPYGYESGAVFVDPSAPPEQRYKLFFVGTIDEQGTIEEVRARYQERFGDALNPKSVTIDDGQVCTHAACGAVSPDGIHWTVLPEPIMGDTTDTLNTCHWNEELGKYVAYTRLYRNGRRLIARVESDDFSLFSEKPKPVLEAPLDWSPSIDIYTNSRVDYPDSDVHLMFPGVFHRFEDRRKVYMASSEDDLRWLWLPNPCVGDQGPTGSWYCGDLNPGCSLVFLSGDRVALPVMTSPEPHKYPRKSESSLGKLAWLTWPKGRLGAIVADSYGEFTTRPFVCGGQALSLNLETTPRVGRVQVEIEDTSGNPLEGFSMEDCIPVSGNSLDFRVQWKNGELSTLKGKAIRMKFQMRLAKLYAFELVGQDEKAP